MGIIFIVGTVLNYGFPKEFRGEISFLSMEYPLEYLPAVSVVKSSLIILMVQPFQDNGKNIYLPIGNRINKPPAFR